MRLVVDEAHLADVVARTEGGEDHFTAALVRSDDTYTAGEDDEQGIGFLALLDDDLAALEPTLDDCVRHRLGLIRRQQCEQRHPANQFEVGQH